MPGFKQSVIKKNQNSHGSFNLSYVIQLTYFCKVGFLNFFSEAIFVGVLFLFPCMGYGESLVFYELPSESNEIQPEYESCKDVNMSLMSSKLRESSSADAADVFSVEEESFKSQLKKRVQGQIEFKIFLTREIRACLVEDKDWFGQKNRDWSLMEKICKNDNQKLRNSIKERWSEMRVQLALSSFIREDRILSDSMTWMDSTPSHSVVRYGVVAHT